MNTIVIVRNSLYYYGYVTGEATMEQNSSNMSPNSVVRPSKPMPPSILDTSENVAKVLLFSQPKWEQVWDCLKERNLPEIGGS